jgi:hypothetical protein
MAETDIEGSSAPANAKDKKSKQQRMLIIIGVVGLLLTYVMLKRMSGGGSSSSSASDPSSAVTAAEANDSSNISSLAASEQQDATNISALGSSLTAIQAQVTGIASTYGSGDGQTGTSVGTGIVNPGGPVSLAPTGYTQPTGESLQGAGYWGGSASSSSPVTDAGGNVFDYISSFTNATAIQESGGSVDFQSSPGVFASAYGSNGQLLSSLTQPGEAPTPLYAKVN